MYYCILFNLPLQRMKASKNYSTHTKLSGIKKCSFAHRVTFCGSISQKTSPAEIREQKGHFHNLYSMKCKFSICQENALNFEIIPKTVPWAKISNFIYTSIFVPPERVLCQEYGLRSSQNELYPHGLGLCEDAKLKNSIFAEFNSKRNSTLRNSDIYLIFVVTFHLEIISKFRTVLLNFKKNTKKFSQFNQNSKFIVQKENI